MKKKIVQCYTLFALAILASIGALFVWVYRIAIGNIGPVALTGAIFTAVALISGATSVIVWKKTIDRARAEREAAIKKLEEERLAEIDRLNAENKKKGEHFRSLLSHSLRMPVAVIQGYAELLAGDMITDESTKQEYLEKIIQRSQYMSEIISRNLTAEESIDNSKLNYAETDFLDIANQTALDLRNAAREKGILIQVLSTDNSAVAMADSYLINRIMFNLLENSLKYMGREGMITIRVMQDAENVTVTVKDDGLGLPVEETGHIFDYRFQGSNKIEGSGYGLYLVKQSVLAHGGKVSAESSKGMGMGISFTIPKNPPCEKE